MKIIQFPQLLETLAFDCEFILNILSVLIIIYETFIKYVDIYCYKSEINFRFGFYHNAFERKRERFKAFVKSDLFHLLRELIFFTCIIKSLGDRYNDMKFKINNMCLINVNFRNYKNIS